MTQKKKPFKKPTLKLGEPEVEYSVRSSFRAVGNSKGLIISSKLIEAAGISGNNLVIDAAEGIIVIREIKKTDINTDLSSWDKQFKLALKNEEKPESDLFEGMKNEFDEEEW